MAENLKWIEVDGIRKQVVEPQVGHRYWLGYNSNAPAGSPEARESVHGFYFGKTESGRHLFLTRNHEGRAEQYTCFGDCFVVHSGYDDGAMGVDVTFRREMPQDLENNFVLNFIKEFEEREKKDQVVQVDLA